MTSIGRCLQGIGREAAAGDAGGRGGGGGAAGDAAGVLGVATRLADVASRPERIHRLDDGLVLADDLTDARLEKARRRQLRTSDAGAVHRLARLRRGRRRRRPLQLVTKVYTTAL